MFNIDWIAFVRLLVPSHLRRVIRLAWLDAIFTQLAWVHTNFIKFTNVTKYTLAHNSQRIYLEKYLNDAFDPTNRGIFIEQVYNQSRLYLYHKSELKPKRYIYRKWDSAVSYLVDEFAVDARYVYKALSPNTNVQPSVSPLVWLRYADRSYLYHKEEFNAFLDFIVWVPVGVPYDDSVMRSLIDFYRFAGKQYVIQTY